MTVEKNEFEIDQKNINRIFSESFYNISDFQRSYAWEKEQ